jgi:4-hydroxy-tetrahydrodipicolinate reductase
MKVAIAGAAGRMGRTLIEAVQGGSGLELRAALEQAADPHIGKDAAAFAGADCGVKITADVERALEGCDVLIDFTRPEGTLRHVDACRKLGVKLVIGTTGFDEAQKKTITEAARDIAIALSPNFSVGVNVTFKLLEVAAKALQEGYDVEILEAHHRHKVDAPSGTALRMGEVVAQARGTTLAKSAVYARQGHTGERPAGAIGFTTMRGGDIVGDHTVMFAGTGERIEITHRSNSRATYAQGALRAARFLLGHKNGLFDMQDVLSLK